MSEHETELEQQLRPPVTSGFGLGRGPELDESVELVADLLAATRLIPADRLAVARGRAQQTGSLARALVEEGIATSEGVARMHAAHQRMPLVDLAETGVDKEAAARVPLHVLERVVAIPFRLD